MSRHQHLYPTTICFVPIGHHYRPTDSPVKVLLDHARHGGSCLAGSDDQRLAPVCNRQSRGQAGFRVYRRYRGIKQLSQQLPRGSA